MYDLKGLDEEWDPQNITNKQIKKDKEFQNNCT